MNRRTKKITAAILALALTFAFTITASAKESIGNGLILSNDVVTLTENSSTVLVATMQDGFDASRLACVSANPEIATVTPVIAVNNIAHFQIDYVGNGSTVVAIYHMDNPAVVAYTTVNTRALIMELPAKLGRNKDNYCTVTGYEFVPYEFHKYANFNDYKYTLKLSYRCDSYKDDVYAKWGCYGYFYDAAGNVLSKVHLYCGSLAKGRVYQSEFHVPVNAVRFSVEGFK
ncbi:MAG: hypothetical protein IJO85_09325 [Lachnospiraceae bacterium]|nr:hypothetical protein [Lachnospiraceae bacterium]